MLRNLVRLAILLLIVHALYRFVPVYVHHHQFKDAVAEAALFSRDWPDAEVVDRVMELARRYRIPIEREAVQVSRDTQRTRIDVSYEVPIEWVPSYTRPWPFTLSTEAWHVTP